MDFPKRKHNYLLCAVLCHFGEIQSGHYVTYRRHRDHWYFTSDADVRRCQTSGKYKSIVFSKKRLFKAFKVFFFFNFSEVLAANPYILFYERQLEPPLLMKEV